MLLRPCPRCGFNEVGNACVKECELSAQLYHQAFRTLRKSRGAEGGAARAARRAAAAAQCQPPSPSS